MIAEIKTFLLAMTPIGELRAAIPIGITLYNLNRFLVYTIAVIGNLVPVVFLLLFLGPVSSFLSKKFKIFESFFAWLFERTRRRYNPKIKKYGTTALPFFVALPLPVTGAWTGSLIAFLFGIPFKKAFLSITTGVIMAAVIVLLATEAGITVEKYFGWQTLIGVLLTISFLWLMYNKRKKRTTENLS